MRGASLCLTVLCVGASVLLCCALSDQELLKEDASPIARPHFIYPRTGRLFHADYVRDNEIFRSLERTNFMRRGPLAGRQRQGRMQDEESVKKHVYLGEGRIPVEVKKEVLAREKDVPLKSVLFKVSKTVVKDPQIERRSKREVAPEDSTGTKVDTILATEPSDGKKSDNVKITSDKRNDEVHEEAVILNENKVDCSNNSSLKNNDTDKTLFVHDSTRESSEAVEAVKNSEVEVDDGGLMKKTIVDDGLKLYPVYRGVKYYYPQTERRLVYSPQLTVQMDVPLVSEVEEEGNATTGLQEEGRGRRPLKKLALPLLLALKLKTAILVPMILGLVALIALKGLWSGLTALGVASALGLKALLGSGAKVLVHAPPPPPPHIHLPPPAVEYAEYWSRRNDDLGNYYSDYRPSSWHST